MQIQTHRWHKYKTIAYPVCLGCGLVRLRNPLTDWCVSKGCDYDDLPEYPKMLKILGKP